MMMVLSAISFKSSIFKTSPSFTEMAFKFFHEGYYYPYVELKCSPAKILQGHNVYGTDWIEQGA
jgi:II/X family phage/plasmid replication protein